MRDIRFRAWDKNGDGMFYNIQTGIQFEDGSHYTFDKFLNPHPLDTHQWELMQFTGLHDKNGKEIFEGDVLEFTDKWEWYRTSYGIKMRFAEPERRAELQKQYDAEPMERREIVMPECYEWLLSSEIQTYWAVVGNVHEHPNLMKQ